MGNGAKGDRVLRGALGGILPCCRTPHHLDVVSIVVELWRRTYWTRSAVEVRTSREFFSGSLHEPLDMSRVVTVRGGTGWARSRSDHRLMHSLSTWSHAQSRSSNSGKLFDSARVCSSTSNLHNASVGSRNSAKSTRKLARLTSGQAGQSRQSSANRDGGISKVGYAHSQAW